ncbi:MAG: hypothetical protein Homavirus5_2 [Homavirus sp.]|uniref:Uncharacterized protein n=1 Tax=Homavirus sp. TaxID=2487769 RepID=A0A3G5A4A6_9VIRU|nr:MAG: hypothetical protein Homavirus5_2 [Homavirus sp.]
MHIIINIFFIFLFLVAIFYAKFPDLYNDNFIQHKLLIFISLFCFQFTILILTKIINKCKIDVKAISFDSLLIATSGVIGYSLYNDLYYSGTTISFFNNNPKFQYINIAIILVLFITVIKIIQMLLTSKSDDCIKYE